MPSFRKAVERVFGMLDRRMFLAAMGASLTVGALAIAVRSMAGIDPASASTDAAKPEVTVWKSPSCGCCGGWVDHMRAAGFPVTVHDVDDVEPVKTSLGVPARLQSCHTALVGGYALEGHVPADSVLRLLRERPAAVGLAVPGMPQGSPGMETGVKDPYDVVLFGGTGGDSVFERR